MKKYCTINAARRAFGLSRAALKRCSKHDANSLKWEPTTHPNRAISKDVVNVVKAFYIREDISRQTAGKKETVTRKKTKKQKRFVIEPISRTYQTFRQEHPTLPISLALFKRLCLAARLMMWPLCPCFYKVNISGPPNRCPQVLCP
jgi:hypothetical protein